jgi:hypothetical protein
MRERERQRQREKGRDRETETERQRERERERTVKRNPLYRKSRISILWLISCLESNPEPS